MGTASHATTGGFFSQTGLEDARSLNSGFDLSHSDDPAVPTFDVFREEIIRLNPQIQPFLADRLADAQVHRYRRLVEQRVIHSYPASQRTGLYGAAQEGQSSLPVVTVTRGNFPPWAPLPLVKEFPCLFECPICFDTRAFSKPSAWMNHIREDVAPYVCLIPECEWSCSFKIRKDLTRHEKQVQDDRPHGVALCLHAHTPPPRKMQ